MKEKLEKYIREWEDKCYFDGIPDEVPLRIEQLNKAPSYKAIVKAILRNDLTTLGIHPKKSKYYSILKKIEIDARNKTP